MAFEGLKSLAQPTVTPEHKENLEKMSEFQKIHEIDPKKSSYQIPGDFEKDEKGEVIKKFNKKTQKVEPVPHFTPYSELAEKPEALKSVMEEYHQPLATGIAKSRKEYASEQMKLPENIGPVTKRVLSHKSYGEMDDKDRNMFNTFYKEATNESFIPNFKEDIKDYRTDGEMALFIDDWSDAIRRNKGLRDAVLKHIPADYIANTTEKDDPEVMARYLYKTSDSTLDKIQDSYFNGALREIIRHKKGA